MLLCRQGVSGHPDKNGEKLHDQLLFTKYSVLLLDIRLVISWFEYKINYYNIILLCCCKAIWYIIAVIIVHLHRKITSPCFPVLRKCNSKDLKDIWLYFELLRFRHRHSKYSWDPFDPFFFKYESLPSQMSACKTVLEKKSICFAVIDYVFSTYLVCRSMMIKWLELIDYFCFIVYACYLSTQAMFVRYFTWV